MQQIRYQIIINFDKKVVFSNLNANKLFEEELKDA